MTSNRDDYDSPWKDALERHFPEFMAFYFPVACADIDWSRGHDFLDNELQQVVQDAQLGRRYVDKLVRVTLPGGAEKWVLIHIEVQGSREAEFPERMFVYNYRLYDRYRRPAVSLAVLADDDPGWAPSSFGFQALGCRLRLDFPTVKLLDWAGREDDLLAEENPFAVATVAHLLTRATRGDMAARYAAKWKLVRLLYERDWDRQRITDLFAFIDWMMRLPDDLERQLWQDLRAFEARKQMRYVVSGERLATERALQQGLEQGRQQGLEQGLEQGREGEARRMLLRLLERRFGPVPQATCARVQVADLETLERWIDRLLDAATLDDVFVEDRTH